MLSTLYITLLLGVMAFLFSRDMDNLVIRPIETMVDSVTRLAANPAHKLEAVKSVKYETDALRVSLNKIAKTVRCNLADMHGTVISKSHRGHNWFTALNPRFGRWIPLNWLPQLYAQRKCALCAHFRATARTVRTEV